MKILVIGGTRFLGKKLTQLLVENKKNKIVIISRKAGIFNNQCMCLETERSEGIKKLKGSHFDLIIDFIAYNEDAIKQIKDSLTFKRYFLISTCWMPKLNINYQMNEFIMEIDPENLTNLPQVTVDYLLGKRTAENYLKANFKSSHFTIVRLPLLLGVDDHTGRLEFYVSRLIDPFPVILVDGGDNLCQLGFVDEIAHSLSKIIQSQDLHNLTIIEALPSTATKVKDVLKIIKHSLGSTSDLLPYSREEIDLSCPEYLLEEPLWREREFAVTSSNIYNLLDIVSKDIEVWLENVCNQMEHSKSISKLRKIELDKMNFQD
jgi:nucleoside-diphosphate-sugar epimerase